MADDRAPDFLAGVIEGFYSPPWSAAERAELLGWMAAWKLNTYLYAPKDDLKLRAAWRESYSLAEAEALGALARACRERGIRLVCALSPGLDIRYGDAGDLERILARFEQVRALGVGDFALLFDDIPDRMREEDGGREELDLLLGYVRAKRESPDVAFRSDFHLPGTCRGGMVARLQRLLALRPDGVFAPSATRAATSSTADPPPMSTFTIRTARPEDRAAPYHVCLKTGDQGRDGEPFYRDDPDALGRIFVGPYLLFEPELALMLEDDQGVCGYAFGALDSRAFYARYEREWRPKLCAEFPMPEGDPATWTRAETVHPWYHRPEYFCPEPYEDHPSHMHIDLLERGQGRGHGRRMMEEVMERLRDRGSPGAHLGVSVLNTPAWGSSSSSAPARPRTAPSTSPRGFGTEPAVRTPTAFVDRFVVPPLTALGENTYLTAVRSGVVSLVPLTIIGGLFLIVGHFPLGGWDRLVAPYRPVLRVPVTATFGLLSVYLCFGVGYHLGKLLKQEAIVSASLATLVYLMIQLQPDVEGSAALPMERLGSRGLFTAILVALVCVRVQKLLTDRKAVVRLEGPTAQDHDQKEVFTFSSG